MGLKVEVGGRNSFEARISKQLEDAGVLFDYEPFRLPVMIPAREAKYLPDWHPHGTNILIEGKGLFGGRHVSGSAAARKKMALFREQHPEWDLRFVFQNSRSKIYKGSKTTYADWAADHGFKWSDRGIIPEEWLNEIKQAQAKEKRREGRKRLGSSRARYARNVRKGGGRLG